MLDRVGGEVARATTIVRYAEGSAFSEHTHTLGEEYVVLQGIFSDETGDHGPGRYVRNPPTSRHTPYSTPGCVIFVKLRQFDPGDRTWVDTELGVGAPTSGIGLPRTWLLHEDIHEQVVFEEWAPGLKGELGHRGGLEMLVVSGSATLDGEALPPWSWVRLPPDDRAAVTSNGARVWIKRGHLTALARLGPPAYGSA